MQIRMHEGLEKKKKKRRQTSWVDLASKLMKKGYKAAACMMRPIALPNSLAVV
jgi:hypothetical protein